MKHKDYGYAYDYSGHKPISRFVHKITHSSIDIFKEMNGFVILQVDAKGNQQRLKVDELGLTKMLQALDKHKWHELHVNK
jgi:hypothetical protein